MTVAEVCVKSAVSVAQACRRRVRTSSVTSTVLTVTNDVKQDVECHDNTMPPRHGYLGNTLQCT